MTAYAYGVVVTHVMEWNHSRDVWVSLCGRRPEINPRDYLGDWPLAFDPQRRRLPWCRLCVRKVAHQVERLTTVVLIPAQQEGHPMTTPSPPVVLSPDDVRAAHGMDAAPSRETARSRSVGAPDA